MQDEAEGAEIAGKEARIKVRISEEALNSKPVDCLSNLREP